MAIVFIGNSALDYWFWVAKTHSIHALPIRHFTPTPCHHSKNEIMEEGRLFIPDGKEICILSKDYTVNREGIKTQSFNCPLPSCSIYKIRNGVFAASPELAFVTAGRNNDLISMIKLGYDLTARYVLPDSDFDGDPTNIEPITTIEKLSRFVDRCDGFHGVKTARMATPHIIAHSESPMETSLMMRLTLPRRLGGYGLMHPTLNDKNVITDKQLELLRRFELRPDACWPSHKLVLEYDSDKYHTGKDKITKDSRRRNDLMRIGFDVVTVTYDEYQNLVSLDNIYDVIRKKLGLRRYQIDSSKSYELQKKLKYLRKFNGLPQ